MEKLLQTDMDSRELLVENLSIVHQVTTGPGSWISVQLINLLLVELCSSIKTSTTIKGTWRSPNVNGLTVNQIYHICIIGRFQHTLLDVKVCRGADIGSDHYLVRGRLQIKLQSVAKIAAKRHDVPAIEHLRNSSKVQEYSVALQNRFDCLANEVKLEDMWDNFKQTVTDVSMEVLGKRPRKVKEQHLSPSYVSSLSELWNLFGR